MSPLQVISMPTQVTLVPLLLFVFCIIWTQLGGSYEPHSPHHYVELLIWPWRYKTTRQWIHSFTDSHWMNKWRNHSFISCPPCFPVVRKRWGQVCLWTGVVNERPARYRWEGSSSPSPVIIIIYYYYYYGAKYNEHMIKWIGNVWKVFTFSVLPFIIQDIFII